MASVSDGFYLGNEGAFGRNVLHMRSRGTTKWRVVVGLNILLVVSGIGQWALLLLSGCIAKEFVECGGLYYQLTDIIDTVKNGGRFACLIVLYVPYMARSLCVLDPEGRVPGTRWLSARSLCKVGSGEWTIAASQGVFTESLRTLQSAHGIALIGGGVYMVLVGVIFLSIEIGNAYQIIVEQTTDGPGQALCGQHPLCLYVFHMTNAISWLLTGTTIMMGSVVLSTPLRMWSPAARQAIYATNNTQLVRLLYLPSILLALSVWTVHLTVVGRFVIGNESGGIILLYYYAAASIITVLVTFVLSIRCSGVAPAIRRLTRKVPKPSNSYVSALSVSLPGGDHHPPIAGNSWNENTSYHKQKGGGFRKDSGIRFQRTTVLLLNIYLWSCADTIRFATSWERSVLFLARASLGLVLLLYCKDCEADFEYLASTGAGLGLVVSAKQLRCALHSYLHGLPARSSKKLRMFTATLLRMHETVAISYRWQPTNAKVAEGLSLNMSRWQMESLYSTLQRCNAKYVWLDNLSVPQTGFPELKKTLLSRMTAVYATASWVLVLRSLESETNRYHQRGWTLQEFCVAQRLHVLTEVAEQPAYTVAEAGSEVAVVEAETDKVMELRQQWMHHVEHTPFWLSRGLAGQSTAIVKEMYDAYLELSQFVRTGDPADHIRALYPLVFDCPVESQRQLLVLVTQVKSMTGIEDPRVDALQLSIHGGHSQNLEMEARSRNAWCSSDIVGDT